MAITYLQQDIHRISIGGADDLVRVWLGVLDSRGRGRLTRASALPSFRVICAQQARCILAQ
jgi:hypothetical protein